jgi:hypothetical protein
MRKKVLEKMALNICDFSLLKSTSVQILVHHNVKSMAISVCQNQVK